MIHWAHKGRGLETMGAAGWSYSNVELQKHLAALGMLDDSADVSLSFCTAGSFRPYPNRRNVLFTMWESVRQAHEEVLPIVQERRPDVLLVPCGWCRETIEPLVECPVRVVPLGYDDTLYAFRKRRWRPRSGTRFRFLYLGAPNYRKFSVMDEVYKYLHSRSPVLRSKGIEFEFYIKSSGDTLANPMLEAARLVVGDGAEEVEPGLWHGKGFDKHGLPNDDWWLDNRFLSRADIVRLYESAHCVLNLHTGEGWSLLALEAMASGAPLIVSDWSGTTEFANARNAHLVSVNPCRATVLGDDGPVEVDAMMPSSVEAVERAISVLADYYSAAEKAKRAARDVAGLTWRNSALKLCTALAELGILPAVGLSAA